MPVVSLKEIVDPALEQRYGVPAINILNDLTLEGVLSAAVQERSPLIVQTSVKTVRSIGSRVLYAPSELRAFVSSQTPQRRPESTLLAEAT